MSILSLALYCEGSTDNRFLPPSIEKTARYILDEHQQRHVAVSALQVIMERLIQIPSYQRFVGDLTKVLTDLKFISETNDF